jgi:hypothetical protein
MAESPENSATAEFFNDLSGGTTAALELAACIGEIATLIVRRNP